MIVVSQKAPELVFVSPNLTLEFEGLNVADEIKDIHDCWIYVFSGELNVEGKNILPKKYSYELVDENDQVDLKHALMTADETP